MNTLKLSSAAEFHSGRDLKEFSEDGTVPVYAIGGLKGYTDKPICPDPLIAIGAAGTIGKPRYYSEPVWITSTQIFLTAKPGIDLRYLFCVLDGLDWDWFIMASGNRQTLDDYRLKNFSIPLLPLASQRDFAQKYFTVMAEEERERHIVDGLKRFKSFCLDTMFV